MTSAAERLYDPNLVVKKEKRLFLDLTVVYIWHDRIPYIRYTVPATVYTDTVRIYGRMGQHSPR